MNITAIEILKIILASVAGVCVSLIEETRILTDADRAAGAPVGYYSCFDSTAHLDRRSFFEIHEHRLFAHRDEFHFSGGSTVFSPRNAGAIAVHFFRCRLNIWIAFLLFFILFQDYSFLQGGGAANRNTLLRFERIQLITTRRKV